MFNLEDRIAIYGHDRFALFVIKRIKQYGFQNVSIIISDELSGTNIYNTPVFSLYDAVKLYHKDFDKILIVEEMPYKDEKYLLLHKYGFSDVYVLLKESKEIFSSKNVLSESAIQHFNLINKPVLRYVELHLVDFCNLNCKGCTHFSNICKNSSEAIVNVESLKKQLEQLKKLVDVSVIRLMGGEPLLHPELDKILPIVRRIFPKARIFLVTNALLLTKLNKSVLKIIRDNDIFINISLYEPTVEKYMDIKKFLDSNSIIYFWGNGEKEIDEQQIIRNFHKCLSTKANNIVNSVDCYNKYCWFLRNGKISKCGYPLLIHILNSEFSVDFHISDQDMIDIFECNDGWKIVEFLNNFIPFCKYCRNKTVDFKWISGRVKPELKDYVI